LSSKTMVDAKTERDRHDQLIMSIDRTRDEIENLTKVMSKCFHMLIQEIAGRKIDRCDNCGCNPGRGE